MGKTVRKALVAAAAAAMPLSLLATSPALAVDNVNIYLENDNDYDLQFDTHVDVYRVTKASMDGSRPTAEEIFSEYDRNNYDACDLQTTFSARVSRGQHAYVCFSPLPPAVGHSFGEIEVQLSNFSARVKDGLVFPLDGSSRDYVHNDTVGEVLFTSDPRDELRGEGLRPSWLGARFDKRPDLYALTYEVHWQAPVEQDAQLMNLRENIDTGDCTITGTPGDDVLTGTDGDDVICGLGGDDVIDGKGGDDIIKGGAGNDAMRGGDGDDAMGGGPGDDVMDGGAGNDAMHGGVGEDILVGGAGDDLTDGGSGEDILLPEATLAQASSVLGGAWTPDPIFGGAYTADGNFAIPREKKSTQVRHHYRHIHDLASADELGNIIEDGNGDGISAQDLVVNGTYTG